MKTLISTKYANLMVLVLTLAIWKEGLLELLLILIGGLVFAKNVHY